MPTLVTQVISPGSSSDVTIPPGVIALKVSNTSPYDCNYDGYGTVGDDWIPSGTEYMLYAETYYSGQINLSLVNNRNITPANPGVILLVGYLNKDSIPKGIWPISIPQSVVNTSSSMSNTLINTGNPPLQIVIQIQPNDTSGTNPNTILADNSGNFHVQSDNAGVLKNLLNLIAGASPSVTIADTGIPTTIEDALTVVSTINNMILGPSADSQGIGIGLVAQGCINQTGGHLYLSGTGTSGFGYQEPQNTTRWTLHRMNANGNTTCGSGTTISHGLGVTPDLILGTPRITQPGSATVGTASWGSTTFQATVGAGSAISWIAMQF